MIHLQEQGQHGYIEEIIDFGCIFYHPSNVTYRATYISHTDPHEATDQSGYSRARVTNEVLACSTFCICNSSFDAYLYSSHVHFYSNL